MPLFQGSDGRNVGIRSDCLSKSPEKPEPGCPESKAQTPRNQFWPCSDCLSKSSNKSNARYEDLFWPSKSQLSQLEADCPLNFVAVSKIVPKLSMSFSAILRQILHLSIFISAHCHTYHMVRGYEQLSWNKKLIVMATNHPRFGPLYRNIHGDDEKKAFTVQPGHQNKNCSKCPKSLKEALWVTFR